VILDKIYFETDKATLLKRAYGIRVMREQFSSGMFQVKWPRGNLNRHQRLLETAIAAMPANTLLSGFQNVFSADASIHTFFFLIKNQKLIDKEFLFFRIYSHVFSVYIVRKRVG